MRRIFKNISPFLIIIILSSLLIINPFFHKGIFTAHDIATNLTYFGAFYSSLTEGTLIPRWAGNIANLYGSPTIMFFYPLSYYFASIIHFIGFSLVNSMKIYLFITFITSAIFMYIWLKKHTTDLAAITGALLYVYAPYRINDIYARGSVAENTTFVFVPLLAYAIYSFWQKPDIKRTIILSILIAAFVLSHPFMLIIFAPFYLAYIIYLKLDIKKVIYLLFSSIISLLITAFYTIPLIFETKYTHYDISPFNGREYAEQFVTIKKLILPIWNFIDIKGQLEYQTYQIGLVQIAVFLLCVILIVANIKSNTFRKKWKLFFGIGFVNFFISIFLMLNISDFFYKLLPILKRIEYPWRFLSLNLFSLAILAAFSSLAFDKKIQKLLILVILVSGILLYLPYAKGHGYKNIADDYYLYNITENTDAFATLPRWAAQPDKYPRIAARYQVINGDALVTTLKRTNNIHIFNIENKEGSRIADDTFYFPGWNVYIDNKPVNIEFQDPDFRGIITFNVPAGRHLVEVIFRNTKLRTFADMISLVSIIFIIIIFVYGSKIQKSLHRYTSL